MMLIPKKLLIPLLLLFPLTAYVTIITIAYSRSAGAADEHAFERSKDFDREKGECKKFEQLGFKMTYAMTESVCTVQLSSAELDMQKLESATVYWKRPSDHHDDFIVEWPQATSSIACVVPKRGRWQVEYSGVYKGDKIRFKKDIFVSF